MIAARLDVDERHPSLIIFLPETEGAWYGSLGLNVHTLSLANIIIAYSLPED